MLAASLTAGRSTAVSPVLAETFTGGRGLNGSCGATISAPGTAASGGRGGSDDGRPPSWSTDGADESLAAVARGIRPSAKSNTVTHAHTQTLPKTDFRSARASEFAVGRRDARRAARLPLHRCDALFRLITDAVGRRRRPTDRPAGRRDKDQTAEMAATDWSVI